MSWWDLRKGAIGILSCCCVRRMEMDGDRYEARLISFKFALNFIFDTGHAHLGFLLPRCWSMQIEAQCPGGKLYRLDLQISALLYDSFMLQIFSYLRLSSHFRSVCNLKKSWVYSCSWIISKVIIPKISTDNQVIHDMPFHLCSKGVRGHLYSCGHV